MSVTTQLLEELNNSIRFNARAFVRRDYILNCLNQLQNIIRHITNAYAHYEYEPEVLPVYTINEDETINFDDRTFYMSYADAYKHLTNDKKEMRAIKKVCMKIANKIERALITLELLETERLRLDLVVQNFKNKPPPAVDV